VLSTPNEAAIYEVARAMRDDGFVVTLSGEGADELLGGYAQALDTLAHAHAQHDPGVFLLDNFSWMTPAARGAVLNESWANASEHRAQIEQTYRTLWDS